MTQSNPKKTLFVVAITSYTLLITLHMVWPFLNPDWSLKTKVVVATIHLVPLLLPFFWMLKKHAYAFQLSLFLILLYFIEAVLVISQNQADRWLGVIELVLVLVFFFAALMFLRKKSP